MSRTSRAKKVISKLFRRKDSSALEVKPKPPVSVPKGKIRSILIAQPKPETERHAYSELIIKYKVNIAFKPFLHMEPLTAKEFRRWKINPLEFQSVIFT